MKFLVIFASVFGIASAFDLRKAEIEQSNFVVPVVESQGRIINGGNAVAGQFPYHVGINLKKSHFLQSWCSGSLISQNWVLTAAHCTVEILSATVHLGSTVLSRPEISFNVSTSDILVHPSHNDATNENDISLINIPPVTYSKNIQPVKLPSASNSASSYVGEMAIASGWGYTFDGGFVVDYLQWTTLEIISRDICSKTYSAYYKSLVCTSTKSGSSPCHGDSGGALVLESTKTQIGLTAFGSERGCEEGYPVAFTRVASFLQWIEDNTGVSY